MQNQKITIHFSFCCVQTMKHEETLPQNFLHKKCALHCYDLNIITTFLCTCMYNPDNGRPVADLKLNLRTLLSIIWSVTV